MNFADCWHKVVTVAKLLLAALPAATANVVYDAVGIRLRDIPFTPERVIAALRM